MEKKSFQETLVKNYSKLIGNVRKFQKEDPAVSAIEKQRDKEYMTALKNVLSFIKEHSHVEIVDALQQNSGRGWSELKDIFNDTYASMSL